ARLVPDLAGGQGDRASFDGCRPTPVRALPVRRELRVPVNDLDVGEGDAEFFGGDLGEGRLLPLAVRMASRVDGRLPGGMEPYGRRAPQPARESGRGDDRRRAEAAELHVRREADPHEPTFPPGFRLFLAELLVSDLLQGLVERPRVVAAVVREAHRGGEGELVGGDEILPPLVGWISLQLVS